MVPGPVQAAAVAAWADDEHVDAAAGPLPRAARADGGRLAAVGVDAPMPAGAFYLWVPAPDGDAWASPVGWPTDGACSCHPGSSTATTGAGHVRVAVVQPDDRLDLVADRLREAMVDPVVG